MKRVVLLLGLAALALGGVSAAATPRHDYAAVALDVLPPGENGGVTFDANTTDQATLYDGLTPLGDKVTSADLNRWFKPETLGLGGDKAVRTEKLPRAGAVIQRDKSDVAARDRKDAGRRQYGAGWATAEDRGLLLQLIRGPARAAALDIPGIDPIGLALSGKTFVPSAQTETFLAKQLALLRGARRPRPPFRDAAPGLHGGDQRVLQDRSRRRCSPDTPNDVIACRLSRRASARTAAPR